MNKFLFFLLFICGICAAQNSKPIITKWNTNLTTDVSNNTRIVVGASNFYYTYQKEGTSSVSEVFFVPASPSKSTIIHLPSAGVFVIKITPNAFPFVYSQGNSLNNYGFEETTKLIELTQWGDYQFSSESIGMFRGCKNLKITATDIPQFGSEIPTAYMFQYCENLTNIPNIQNWNLSTAKDMSFMFHESRFNQDISTWNVSNVTNMRSMFDTTPFNQNIGNWNVSNVTNMANMFGRAQSFNKNIGNWDVSNVSDMNNMFIAATAFNQNIGNWNVSNVTNLSSMFRGAKNFNQNIGNWNISKVTNLSGMFMSTNMFNQSIANWDVSNVTDMTAMFRFAKKFNQNIGNWNVSNVIRMSHMFSEAPSFNQDIGNWNVSKVTEMDYMFGLSGFINGVATIFNQDISNWNVSNVTTMNKMFHGSIAFNQNIGNWNVSKVTSMDFMFSEATAFNQNLGNWKLNNNVGLGLMLDKAGLSCQNYALTLKGWSENPLTPISKNLGAANIKYANVGKTYRDLLTTQKGWTFSGDIFEPSCNDALSTNENSLSEKLNFYPNPTTGRIFYQSQTDEPVQISNTAGQLLKTVKVTKGTNQIDVSEFPKGVYFLKAGVKTSKLLKN